MLNLEKFFKDKPVPQWFKEHALFKDIKESHKIFPLIGLSNFEADTNIKNSNDNQIITTLCRSLAAYVGSALYYFRNSIYNPSNHYPEPYLSEKERTVIRNKVQPAIDLLTQLLTQLNRPKIFVADFEHTKGLYLFKDILDTDDKVFAKKHESLFKVYTKLSTYCTKHYNYSIFALDSIPAFKEYSSNNFNGKLKIIFSADGVDGAWDILTMSQRGISSCQSWTGQYKNSTIGSVVDPFTAIIYLTSGSKTQYGSKMIRRCIVRFVVDSSVKKPALFLEYMYPGHHPATMQAFKDAIKSKVGDRFTIVDQHNKNISSRYYVPYSDMTSALLKHSKKEYVNVSGTHNYYGILPYRDTFMEYRIKELNKLDNVVSDSMSNFGTQLSTALNSMQLSGAYYRNIQDSIKSVVMDKISTENCENLNQYRRKICLYYFANRKKVGTEILKNLQQEMKANKDKTVFIPGIKKQTNITMNKEMLSNMLEEQIMPAISGIMKTTWKNLIDGKNTPLTKKLRKKGRIQPIAAFPPPIIFHEPAGEF